jgi:hypothetical protein
MTLEFFLFLVALAGGLLFAFWLYAAVYDFVDEFVDEWKAKDRIKREKARRMAEAMVKIARFPPMAPERSTGGDCWVEHEPPTGPPIGHERRPARPRAARILD